MTSQSGNRVLFIVGVLGGSRFMHQHRGAGWNSQPVSPLASIKRLMRATACPPFDLIEAGAAEVSSQELPSICVREG